jgi:hypothetical protein
MGSLNTTSGIRVGAAVVSLLIIAQAGRYIFKLLTVTVQSPFKWHAPKPQ